MSWFGPPDCPRCGRTVSLATAWDGDYYTCYPCNREAKKDEERKQKLEDKNIELEERIKQLEGKLNGTNK